MRSQSTINSWLYTYTMQDREVVAWGLLCALLAMASLRVYPARFLGIMAITFALLVCTQPAEAALVPVLPATKATSARVAETTESDPEAAEATAVLLQSETMPRGTIVGPPSSASRLRSLRAFAEDNLRM